MWFLYDWVLLDLHAPCNIIQPEILICPSIRLIIILSISVYWIDCHVKLLPALYEGYHFPQELKFPMQI